ncbi:MAG: sensor histidine kinase, partial [Eubacteriales bacterium]
KFPEGKRSRTGRKLPLVIIAGVIADFAVFYINKTSSGLLFSLLGFLIYIVFTGIIMMIDYGEQEKRFKEQEIQIAKTRVSIMLSQIQPHFLYNTLNSIAELCASAPKEAENAIIEFSEYLRGNMSCITQKEAISFEKELEHLKHYLVLIQTRFGKSLDIELDIEDTRFCIPSLTIQPIVENAINHGIRMREGFGKVRICSREEGAFHVITIIDNGVGFDPDIPPCDGKEHIGIENVKQRLSLMVGGTLSIESEKGVGTTVTIKIPKHMEKITEGV